MRICISEIFRYTLFFLCMSSVSFFALADGGSLKTRWGEHEFIAACRTGNERIVQKYIEMKGFDIDDQLNAGRFKFNTFGLYCAAENNQSGIISLLLSAGAKVNNINYIGWTALHIAARENKIEAMGVLIDNNADVNIASICNQTPLHVAILFCRPEAVSILMRNKPDKTIKSTFFPWSGSHHHHLKFL